MNIQRNIEEAAALGERYPDLSDWEVVNIVAEIVDFRAEPVMGTAHERIIVRAYDHGTDAGVECSRSWGILR